jgi:uncharacterized membrane protein YbhN (UPF0104 family)
MKPESGGREAVVNAARTIGRFFTETIGLHRIGLAASIALILIAATVLYRTLQGIDVREVVDALLAVDRREILLAALFVAGGYSTLTFYDLFALRTIGRHDIPYRIAALSGFTSYSIGHNVGATVFTGGAVRYRIYSAWGLDAIAVAKICFIAGLTFWLGNATVLGLGITYQPETASALNHLPSWVNRGAAILTLLVLASYVSWVWRRPRVVGMHGWQVALPGGPLTLLQIVIGLFDLAFCALAMYMLVPDEPNIGFVTLAIIFVSATLLGFASHAPGGIGVFDATMLVALWQFDKEDLLAGLLLFRLLYYIVPFAISLLILGTRELWIWIDSRRPSPRLAAPPKASRPLGTPGE